LEPFVSSTIKKNNITLPTTVGAKNVKHFLLMGDIPAKKKTAN